MHCQLRVVGMPLYFFQTRRGQGLADGGETTMICTLKKSFMGAKRDQVLLGVLSECHGPAAFRTPASELIPMRQGRLNRWDGRRTKKWPGKEKGKRVLLCS